ncbi:UDP-glucuronosyltransferase 1A9-like [Amphibalanus amphitrite]|uniref:UDP-glucuronosyltransferase 1A9-like n=1 Tax=Amphibalanus amphitrite TaxID=1232801 RepID=UPI001C905EFE|nr:UDP-glucuronosyltransferase 1A9-like [Amphibalanus amphitrite]
MASVLSAAICALLLLSPAAAINVLILHPVYAGSHELTLRVLGEQMVARGHNVTQIRFLSRKSKPVDSPVELLSRTVNNTDLRSSYFDRDGVFVPPTDLLWQRTRRLSSLPTDVFSMTHAFCESLLGDHHLFESLRQRRFDVALVDIISNECGLALAAALKLPVVGFWGFSFVGGESHATSTMNLPSVTPTFLSDTGPQMGFTARLYNTLCMIVHKVLLQVQFRIANEYIQRHYPTLPDAATLVNNIDMVLVHSNFLASQPVLLPPNVQMIGCTQCRDARPLPKDYEDFMQSAGEHGVIVFSLGITGYEALSVPDDYIEAFMNVFGRLKQKVLMRFTASRLKRVPSNVKVVDYLPQIDVLGHNQTRVFVTHCGMNGMMEAFYAGVPLLGVPIFGDQGDNSKFMHHRELGIGLDKFGLTEEILMDSLNKLLYTNKYRDNVRRVRDIWRMEPESATDRALHWIELVSRFGAPSHLRMVDGHLRWYQYWLLDVAAVYAAVLLAAVMAVVLGVRGCLRRLTGKAVTTPVSPRKTKTKKQ